jgi:stearoyl-CoA desaturase (delta-9 desaturase)
MSELVSGRRFKLGTFIGIALIHLVALVAVFPYFFSWAGLILFFVMCWATASLGVSLAYHRLLSHRSYKTKPGLRYTLTVLACLALQSGPITWSATHRLHHRESDHEDDPHSPLISFVWSHFMWLFYDHPLLEDDDYKAKLVPDLASDPVMRFLDRYFFGLWVALALISFLIGFWFGGLQLGLSLVVWGSLLRTVVVWHTTWFVNSATHLWGYRNYGTSDDSRNLWWVALLTWGEGWHNNHHAVAGSAKFGHRWWEFDATWLALCFFKSIGLVSHANVAEPLRSPGLVQVYTGKAIALSRSLRKLLEQIRPRKVGVEYP